MNHEIRALMVKLLISRGLRAHRWARPRLDAAASPRRWSEARTTFTRSAGLCAVLLFGSVPVMPFADAAGSGQVAQDAGWLQLRHDQRVYRERVGPLSGYADQNLRRIEQRQQTDWRATEFDRGSVGRPISGLEETAGGLGRRQLEQRRIDQQRLGGRIERETLNHHRR
ncbi:hypothetical protein ABC977_13625 [Thioalkalicoccus limnaeus]|uniref:Uncharacterized protein n=1 Tax=Thioalkalicoccus limnaeus TaxID=120681 RepID=A0ABV4BFY0_9GAMM